MKRLRPLLLACALALAGCAGLGVPRNPPEVTLANVDVLEVGLLEQRLGLHLRVLNPNDTSLRINGLSYTLEVNGRPFAKGVSDKAVSVPRFGEAILEVPATTNIGGLLRQLDEWRKGRGRETMDYRLTGTLYPAFGPGIPFDHSGQVPLPAELRR
ncbi:MAG: LEA type 2 family protein [Pseudomonadota bacterium]|jgi:LEA14-like dessication related protein